MSGEASKLIMAEPSAITDVEDLRAYRRGRLAAAFRVFAQFGYNTGPGGHAAVRDPEHPDYFWTNPFGRSFESLRASDMLLVDVSGEALEGEGIVNRAAFAIHSGIHGARPDVIASVHLHGVHGMAWSSLGRLLDPITQDACAFFEDHEVFEVFNGAALELEDGIQMAKVLGDKKALILQNHGLLTAAGSIESAAFFMIRMQMSCEVQLLAEGAGSPVHISDTLAHDTWLVNGTERAGWFGFQPFLENIVRLDPTVLD